MEKKKIPQYLRYSPDMNPKIQQLVNQGFDFSMVASYYNFTEHVFAGLVNNHQKLREIIEPTLPKLFNMQMNSFKENNTNE